ncbi:MAG: DUF2800 domain-containing protein, partial [Patescibacteria group bacterium]|nr:DUF2800 domain-containing protein [Patescibacteria group bacterium]
IGQDFGGIVCTREMAEALQVYISHVRPLMTQHWMIEARIGSDPDTRPHKDFYGTVDFAAYTNHPHEPISVVDYKHGVGISVDAEENPQLMYYAYGILHNLKTIGVSVELGRPVVLTIVQPRGFHPDGPIREWQTTAGEIKRWVEEELLPAMRRAETSEHFDAGSWCRFCPAKLVCPLLAGLFGAAQADTRPAIELTDEVLGREYQYIEAVEHRIKALKAAALSRLMGGSSIPGIKLVHKKGNRVFKDGAEAVLAATLGEAAYTPPALKSPAEMEKVSPEAPKLVREWCYIPETGYTVALESDRRQACEAPTPQNVFQHAVLTKAAEKS